jgi:hypothetical protein
MRGGWARILEVVMTNSLTTSMKKYDVAESRTAVYSDAWYAWNIEPIDMRIQ